MVVSYSVGDAAVLESHDLETLAGQPVFVRTLDVGRSTRDLLLRVANVGTAVALTGPRSLSLTGDERFVTLHIPAASTPLRLALRLAHRAYVMEQGQITRSGSGAQLLADPAVQSAYLGV